MSQNLGETIRLQSERSEEWMREEKDYMGLWIDVAAHFF